jgi:hypothetical protein
MLPCPARPALPTAMSPTPSWFTSPTATTDFGHGSPTAPTVQLSRPYVAPLTTASTPPVPGEKLHWQPVLIVQPAKVPAIPTAKSPRPSAFTSPTSASNVGTNGEATVVVVQTEPRTIVKSEVAPAATRSSTPSPFVSPTTAISFPSWAPGAPEMLAKSAPSTPE